MNTLEIGLAFLEGLALIASPCILPILPLILASATTGGRKRPYGIIIGFVLAFSLFALLARELVSYLNLDLDLIKQASLVLLFILGLTLLSTRLSERFSQFTQRFASFGQQHSQSQGDGLFSGIYIGALIGLVWTPCAGPILAAVLVQVIQQSASLDGTLIILAFALGAAIPMFIIALTGRKLANSTRKLSQYSELIRRILGILILLAVAYMAWGDRLLSNQATLAGNISGTELQKPLAKPYAMPSLENQGQWINSEHLPTTKNKVVLIDFWTYSCINCIRTLPYLKAIYQKYQPYGLEIISVHAPEFEFEKKLENVQSAVTRYEIKNPVVLDNQLTIWKNFQNKYWPAHYLVNQQGQVVYQHFGEGAYDTLENNIRFLLGLAPEQSQLQQGKYTQDRTPETYLGYQRSKLFSSPENIVKNQTHSYQFPEQLAENHWALQGDWLINKQKVVAQQSKAQLKLSFYARKVFLVLGNNNNEPITLTLNYGTEQKQLSITEHKLYTLLELPEAMQGEITLSTEQSGLEAYAFTFE